MLKLLRAVALSVSVLVCAAGCSSAPRSLGENSSPQSDASAALQSENGSEQALSSAQEEVASVVSAPVESAELVPGNPILLVYLYRPESGLYEKREAGEVPKTLYDVLCTVAGELKLPAPPVLSIKQQKGMVTVNLAPEALELYSKDEQSVLFNSFSMTLGKNHSGYEWIQYQLDGEWGVFGGEEWQTAPLKLMEGDQADFKKLREGIKYLPAETYYNKLDEMNAINSDATAKEIAELLSSAYIEKEVFASPAELPVGDVVQSGLHLTQGYVTRAGAASYMGYPVADELEPIFASVSLKLDMQEDLIWLEEHVEQSIKRLFGSGYVFEHQTAGKYTYFPEEGVYTPPHMGGGYGVLTAVLDYADSGENMTATVSYACEVMGGIFEPKDFEKQISAGQLENYLRNKAKRYTVTLGKADDGTLYIISQQPA